MAKLDVFDAAEKIPEPLRDYYVERDGRWYPDAPELWANGKTALEQERRRRADAVRKAEEREQALKDALEEMQRLKTERPEPGEAQKSDAERLKREYDERIKAIEGKLAAADEKTRAAEQKLAETRITDALRTAALEAGVAKDAVEDLVALPRFRGPWRLDQNGEPVAFEGESIRFDGDGKNLSPKLYTQQYVQEHKHWLPPSGGSGATGSGARPVAGVLTATREQLKNPEFYREITAKAQETGAQIHISEASP